MCNIFEGECCGVTRRPVSSGVHFVFLCVNVYVQNVTVKPVCRSRMQPAKKIPCVESSPFRKVLKNFTLEFLS